MNPRSTFYYLKIYERSGVVGWFSSSVEGLAIEDWSWWRP